MPLRGQSGGAGKYQSTRPGRELPWEISPDVAAACESCHMPKATEGGFPIHLFRINTDVSYSTFPTSAEFLGNTKKVANTLLTVLTPAQSGSTRPRLRPVPRRRDGQHDQSAETGRVLLQQGFARDLRQKHAQLHSDAPLSSGAPTAPQAIKSTLMRAIPPVPRA